MNSVKAKLQKEKEKLYEEIITIRHDISYIHIKKKELFKDFFSTLGISWTSSENTDMKDIQNTYFLNRDTFLKLENPLLALNDDEFTNKVEIINCNINKKQNVLDIKARKYIVLSEWLNIFEKKIQKEKIQEEIKTREKLWSGNSLALLRLKAQISALTYLYSAVE